MTAYTFDQIIDYTRTSAATYVANTGFVTQTPASRNLLTYTQEFDNAAWTKSNAQVVPNVDPAAATLGSELITNGDFASGTTGWTGSGSGGWLISGGVATHTAGTYGTLITSYSNTTTAGKLYVLAFDFAGTGSLNIYSRNTLIGVVSGTGAKRIFFTAATTSGATLNFEDVTFNGTIDNVSVREVIGGLITAPDGTLTGDTLVASAGAAVHNCQQTAGGSGTPLAMSVYVKAGTHSFVQFWHGASVQMYANFNVSAGTVGTVGSSATASITAVGNGWYRCTMAFTPSAAGTIRIALVTSATAAYNESWTATGTESIYLWGAQLEQVPNANLTPSTTELITNGDFSGGTTTGWTASGSTLSVVSGQLQVETTGAAVGFAHQTFTTVANKTYRLVVDVNVVSGTGLISVGVGAGSVSLYPGVSLTGSSRQTIYFTASGTSTTVSLFQYTATAGLQARFDNISIREITGTTGMPTTYTRNVGGLYPPRFDYDPVTLAPRGLLIEEQRTNLLTYSEQFDNASWSKTNATVTANATTSPDGTADADKLVEDTSTNVHFVSQSVTVVASTTYTYSVYLKAAERGFAQVRYENSGSTQLFAANVDLSSGAVTTTSFGSPTGTAASATNAGNGWWRVNLTVTASNTTFKAIIFSQAVSGTNSYTGDGTSGIYVWGAQLEAGSFATSYIPTVASQVTRTADVATVTGANFSRWYNQSEGTLVAEATPAAVNSGFLMSLEGATTADTIDVRMNSGSFDLVVVVSSSVVVDTAGFAATAGAVAKASSAYKINDYAFCVGGAAVQTDTSASVPAVQSLYLGRRSLGNNFNGHIRRIRYYPTRLSNAQLQALTA